MADLTGRWTAGAVLPESPKACGKTETATRRAASVGHLDAHPSDPEHLADPSLALALVGGDDAAPRRNLGFAGQLFESLVVHDLRVLAQPVGRLRGEARCELTHG